MKVLLKSVMAALVFLISTNALATCWAASIMYIVNNTHQTLHINGAVKGSVSPYAGRKPFEVGEYVYQYSLVKNKFTIANNRDVPICKVEEVIRNKAAADCRLSSVGAIIVPTGAGYDCFAKPNAALKNKKFPFTVTVTRSSPRLKPIIIVPPKMSAATN